MIGTRKCGVAVMGIARARYVLNNVCVCMHVCVCVCVCVCVRVCVRVSLQLILCFYSCLDPTSNYQNLASVHYMTLNTIQCIT